jgi:hypothetical protein
LSNVDEAEHEGAWASRHGVFVCTDRFDLDGLQLACLAAEKVAHYHFASTHGGHGGRYYQELLGRLVRGRLLRGRVDPGVFDAADSYWLGRLVGGALAGGSAARGALDRVEPGCGRSSASLWSSSTGSATRVSSPASSPATETACYPDGAGDWGA